MLKVQSYKLYDAHIITGDWEKDRKELDDLLGKSIFEARLGDDRVVINLEGRCASGLTEQTARKGDMVVYLGDNKINVIQADKIEYKYKVIWWGLNEPEN